MSKMSRKEGGKPEGGGGGASFTHVPRSSYMPRGWKRVTHTHAPIAIFAELPQGSPRASGCRASTGHVAATCCCSPSVERAPPCLSLSTPAQCGALILQGQDEATSSPGSLPSAE
ncbi:hypothetical protein H1C71_015346, partial [Ictidomys tridecemlineatus]